VKKYLSKNMLCLNIYIGKIGDKYVLVDMRKTGSHGINVAIKDVVAVGFGFQKILKNSVGIFGSFDQYL